MSKRKTTPKKRLRLSPGDKLMKAIWGDRWKTEAEREAEIEEAVSRVTPEQYKEMWGETVEETVDKIMKDVKEIESGGHPATKRLKAEH